MKKLMLSILGVVAISVTGCNSGSSNKPANLT